MIDYLKNLLTEKINYDEITVQLDNEKRVQIATCALFLEVAHSDDDFSIEEKEFIESTMKEKFKLDDKMVSELIELSMQQTERSVSLYEFTEIINQIFDQNSKFEILKNLWRLVFADGKLDQYEEYFIRKISGNLHMEHSDMIAAKMEVKAENKN
jgi:uncharacterized tellurite resistance protein B-like protein